MTDREAAAERRDALVRLARWLRPHLRKPFSPEEAQDFTLHLIAYAQTFRTSTPSKPAGRPKSIRRRA